MGIACEERFDGSAFRGPGVFAGAAAHDDVAVECLLPTLVDAAVTCRGYRESPLQAPFAGVSEILELHRRHGVDAFKESGNSWEALRYLVDVLGCAQAALSGPVLVSGAPAREVERTVAGETGVQRALASARLEGAAWIMLGSSLARPLARALLDAAPDHGQRVAARPGHSSAAELLAGRTRVIHGAHLLVVGPWLTWEDALRPGDIALAWAEIDPCEVADQLGEAFLDADAALVPELVSFRRKVLLKEAIAARGLEHLALILPDARYLLEMRRAGGYMVGRRHLAAHGGVVDLNRADRARATEGLARIAETVRRLSQGGVPVLPGSAAPSFGVAPGIGLLEELVELSRAGLSLELILRSVTGEARRRLLVDAPSAGLAATRHPGRHDAETVLASIRAVPAAAEPLLSHVG